MDGETGKVPWNLRESFLVLLALLAAGFAGGLLIRFAELPITLANSYLLVGLVQAIAGLGGLYYFVRVKYGLGLQALGLKASNLDRALTRGIGAGLILFVLVIIVGGILQLFLPAPRPQPFAELIINARQSQDLVIPLFIGVVLAPVTEELYFRGFLFPAFKERYGTFTGLTGSSLLFGLMHLDLLRFLPLMVGGMGLAYLYNRTGNLLVAITAHATWNGVMIFLLYFSLRWV